jgi:hypothetical protein
MKWEYKNERMKVRVRKRENHQQNRLKLPSSLRKSGSPESTPEKQQIKWITLVGHCHLKDIYVNIFNDNYE